MNLATLWRSRFIYSEGCEDDTAQNCYEKRAKNPGWWILGWQCFIHRSYIV